MTNVNAKFPHQKLQKSPTIQIVFLFFSSLIFFFTFEKKNCYDFFFQKEQK